RVLLADAEVAEIDEGEPQPERVPAPARGLRGAVEEVPLDEGVHVPVAERGGRPGVQADSAVGALTFCFCPLCCGTGIVLGTKMSVLPMGLKSYSPVARTTPRKRNEVSVPGTRYEPGNSPRVTNFCRSSGVTGAGTGIGVNSGV